MGIFDKYSNVLGKEEKSVKEIKPVKTEQKSEPVTKKQWFSYLNVLNKGGAVNKQAPIKKQEPVKKEELPRQKGASRARMPFNPLLSLLKLGTMIKKDLKLLIRSKTSALIVLLGPLAMILLVGLAFNTSSLYSLRIATYSDGYSDLTNSVIELLKGQQYSMVKANSLELCQNGVKYGDYHLCVVFPKDLQVGNKDNTLQIYVDQSRINLASMISSDISDKVAVKSKELGISLTTDIMAVLDSTKKSLEEKIILVNVLISENSDSTLGIQTAESDLSRINVTFDLNEINFTNVDAKIKAITSKYNLSLVMVNDLKDSVADIKLSITSLHATMEDSQESKAKVVENLKGLRNKLTDSLVKLNLMRSSLNSINADIGSIKVTEAGLIVEPIKTVVEPITKEKKHLSFLFPTMIVLIVMFISVLLSSTVVIREKLSLAYFRNFITPTSDLLYMIGTYLTNIIIVMLQLAVLFAVSLYFFKEQMLSVMASLSLAIFIIASVFILLGMLIGYLFKTEETSTLAAISVSSILLFFSNTILPTESLPSAFREMIKYNPFVLSESIIKKILLFNADLGLVANSLYVLIGLFAILFVVGYISRELTKRSI